MGCFRFALPIPSSFIAVFSLSPTSSLSFGRVKESERGAEEEDDEEEEEEEEDEDDEEREVESRFFSVLAEEKRRSIDRFVLESEEEGKEENP